ncbi:hypothetical protein [Ekhidna sp.]|uniref:hypothetical protein n=1 Tax=Ekhidna sp. TaxID=2608089 RepID=UPI003CCB95F8
MTSYIFFTLLSIIISFNSSAQSPIGYFDSAGTGSNSCYGWAIDPDYPNSSLSIHFYIDGPAGIGQFIGSTIANKPRPDVNSATGYPGDHGFNFTIPNRYKSGYRKIYAYAINLGGGSNLHLNNSPKSIGSVPNGNSTISNWAGVSNIVIRTNNRVAGAIYSLKWYGKEFINNYDHGRQLQSACMFYMDTYLDEATGECYNPTEAGSVLDGTGSTSTSNLQALSTNGAILQTQTQMAFYGGVGYSGRTYYCKQLPNQIQYQNTQPISNHILKKKVKIGSHGVDHAIKYDTEFIIPNNESFAGAQFEVNAVYLDGSFNKFIGYDPISDTQVYYNSSNTPGEQRAYLPIAYANSTYAIGVFSEDYKQITGPEIGYVMQYFGGISSPTGKIGLVRRVPNIASNSKHNFTSYIVVGSLDNVKVAMRQLYSELVSPLNLD